MYSDFKLDVNGELVLGPNGDLEIVYGDEYVAQEILFRLKTNLGDCTVDPNKGCSLESFIGQPNTESLRSTIEMVIENQLVIDGLSFSPSVDVVSINDNELFILIETPSVEEGDRVIQVQAGLDLRIGLVYSRTDFR